MCVQLLKQRKKKYLLMPLLFAKHKRPEPLQIRTEV